MTVFGQWETSPLSKIATAFSGKSFPNLVRLDAYSLFEIPGVSSSSPLNKCGCVWNVGWPMWLMMSLLSDDASYLFSPREEEEEEEEGTAGSTCAAAEEDEEEDEKRGEDSEEVDAK